MARMLPRPTDAELEILRVLWELGPATVRQVHEAQAGTRDEEPEAEWRAQRCRRDVSRGVGQGLGRGVDDTPWWVGSGIHVDYSAGGRCRRDDGRPSRVGGTSDAAGRLPQTLAVPAYLPLTSVGVRVSLG